MKYYGNKKKVFQTKRFFYCLKLHYSKNNQMLSKLYFCPCNNNLFIIAEVSFLSR